MHYSSDNDSVLSCHRTYLRPCGAQVYDSISGTLSVSILTCFLKHENAYSASIVHHLCFFSLICDSFRSEGMLEAARLLDHSTTLFSAHQRSHSMAVWAIYDLFGTFYLLTQEAKGLFILPPYANEFRTKGHTTATERKA